MIVIDKKKILKIVLCVFVVVFVFSFTLNKNDANNYIETVSLPVSGKTVVVDAGHGVPDEGDSLLKLNSKG